ncbi:hypothetical protein J2S64_003188 [Paeniglutamicibacter sulfureus]|uniref:Uncharacterized protein n=1 Tax=Paeniglutamicibacter sulfureus TaxID=43666 RepID=A0ABU2BLH2_9MICC|nr:hypothetical protein [Paeniglutamicibacter sulfureus]
MPKSKVRAKAKQKNTREQRNRRAEDSACAQRCCPPSQSTPKAAPNTVSEADKDGPLGLS